MKVMVLAGGPDREREVSLQSGEQVASGLSEAGHRVLVRDILPGTLGVLDEFEQWGGDVIFPALHGPWGEGGGLQAILDQRGLRYVGSQTAAAKLAMNKHEAKQVMQRAGVRVPEGERISTGDCPAIAPPVVVKPLDEGSSFGVKLCSDQASLDEALALLGKEYEQLLVERLIRGMEITVGVIGTGSGGTTAHRALPAIRVIPASGFYDFHAKYQREDTRYEFDIPMSADALRKLGEVAVAAHEALGCRHLSRTDFLVDDEGLAWCLEVNTMPGFTSHSLLPKAAGRAGLSFSELTDHLVVLASAEFVPNPPLLGQG